MRIFLSWSGETSRLVAKELRNWLPAVLQATRPWYSSSDIAKGARWSSEVGAELAASKVGILCLTNSNLNAPWLMFEAGALAKDLAQSNVIPFLFGVSPADLVGPLSQFQAVRFDREDVHQMLGVINAQLGDSALDGGVLYAVYEKWWPELEQRLSAIPLAEPPTQPQGRTDRELLEELLELARSTAFDRVRGPAGIAGYSDVRTAPVDRLDVSARVVNTLRSAKIETVGDLLKWSRGRLLRETSAGSRTLADVKDALTALGLELAQEPASERDG